MREPLCVHDYVVAASNQLGVLNTLHDPKEVWDAFKRESLSVDEGCVRERRGLGVK